MDEPGIAESLANYERSKINNKLKALKDARKSVRIQTPDGKWEEGSISNINEGLDLVVVVDIIKEDGKRIFQNVPAEQFIKWQEEYDEAEATAHGEKPLRDLARGENVPAEEKVVLEKYAEKAGDAELKKHQYERDKKEYHDLKVVNGIKIDVAWDQTNYIIVFPQIELGSEEAQKIHILDSYIRINKRPEVAKAIFDYACTKAKLSSNVYELLKSVEKYIKESVWD